MLGKPEHTMSITPAMRKALGIKPAWMTPTANWPSGQSYAEAYKINFEAFMRNRRLFGRKKRIRKKRVKKYLPGAMLAAAMSAHIIAALGRPSFARSVLPIRKICPCFTCLDDESLGLKNPTNMKMVICPDCGNKRCPKATHHSQGCTESNEPGQPGSRYTVQPSGLRPKKRRKV